MPDILIVEDEEDVRSLLSFSLRGGDYTVRQAATGEEALEKVRGRTPDLVLLDVNLGGMSGYDLCQRLRGDPRTAATPVVFLTAYTSSDDVRRGLLAGGTAYLMKPFDPVALRGTIDRLLARGSPPA